MTLQYLDTIIAFSVILLGVSLVITILIQMISAFFAYRGTNLLWGVQTLLSTLEPKLADQAKQLATKVLAQPIISDSSFSKFQDVPILGKLTRRWRLASAVSPETLVHALTNLTKSISEKDPTTATLINELLKEVNPEAARKAQMIQSAFGNMAPDYAVQIDKVVQQFGTSTKDSIGKVEAWFNIAMNRAAQRFALYIRLWTILFAVMLALGAHLDSFKIIQQLWTSPEMRVSLINSREAMLNEASILLTAQDDTIQSSGLIVAPQILVEAKKKLARKEKNAMAGLDTTSFFSNMNEAIKWLQDSLKVDESHKKSLIDEYQRLVITELKNHARSITQELEKSKFQLIPEQYPGFFCFDDFKNFLGILITAGFLSLGAPFWFNALKTLSNLRPLVAKREEKA